MVIFLYWIIEHIFYFVKTRKPLFRMAKRPTACFTGSWAGRDNAILTEKLQAKKTA